MKLYENILFIVVSLVYISFYAQNGGCPDPNACNYDSTAELSFVVFEQPVNTGINMTIGIISLQPNDFEINDQIGAFVLLDDDTYYCAGLVTYEGINTSMTVYGDDPLTVNTDGFLPNQEMYFFVKRENVIGTLTSVYNVDFSLADALDYAITLPNNYTTNSVAVILSSTVGSSYIFVNIR